MNSVSSLKPGCIYKATDPLRFFDDKLHTVATCDADECIVVLEPAVCLPIDGDLGNPQWRSVLVLVRDEKVYYRYLHGAGKFCLVQVG